MDVLTDALRSLRVKTEVYGRLELAAPWGIRLPAAHPGYFHSVARGSCWLELDDQRIALSAGDWVFVLGGSSHVLRDAPRSRVRPLPDLYAETGAACGGVLRHGGPGALTTLLSFSFGLEGGWLHPLLARLPRVLHVRSDAHSSRGLDAIIQLVGAEMEAGRPGHEIVATRIADVLLVHALRAHATQLGAKGGWLRALEDPRLGRVLSRIHEAPERAWTVEAMAKIAGMSRSIFAARFQTTVGESPLAYLTRWRMHEAMTSIRESDDALAAIAASVGYGDASAFGKAFRRETGLSPAAYRRQARSA